MGHVYVADPGNNRVQRFDGAGNFEFAWGSKGSGNGQFVVPYAVAVDSTDNVLVTDLADSDDLLISCRAQTFYQVETTHPTFQPVQPRDMNIYVLGSDGNLWLETGPFGKQIPTSASSRWKRGRVPSARR